MAAQRNTPLTLCGRVVGTGAWTGGGGAPSGRAGGFGAGGAGTGGGGPGGSGAANINIGFLAFCEDCMGAYCCPSSHACVTTPQCVNLVFCVYSNCAGAADQTQCTIQHCAAYISAGTKALDMMTCLQITCAAACSA